MAKIRVYYFTIAGNEGVQIDAWRVEADRMEEETGQLNLFRGDDQVAHVDRKYVRAWRVVDEDEVEDDGDSGIL